MKEPQKVEKILQALRRTVKIPLTVKLRTGWDSSGAQALKIAQIAQACGVDAITVHPRTATQGFRGKADWSLIAAIKNTVSIPVIGNGDIVRPEDVLKMQNQTGCDAVMIGRAAIGNPWIFSQALELMLGNKVSFPDPSRHFEVMIQYLKSSVIYFGEQRAIRMMRSRLGWFVKGLRYSSRFRESIKHISTEKDALCRIQEYRSLLCAELGQSGLL
jgi:nifR3 family TIM-barrel protein